MSDEVKRKLENLVASAASQSDENKRIIALAAQFIEIGEQTARAAMERENSEQKHE